MNTEAEQVAILNQTIIPFYAANPYETLLDRIGDAQIVLIGEATHGTDEFYRSRAEITKQLIIHKNFSVIAIEGDWPDVYQLHRYIQADTNNNTNAEQVLKVFKRFPAWMWANEIICNFIQWLREHNSQVSIDKTPISLYGLDLYSLHSSINAVINYLEQVDPNAAKLARERYDCLNTGHFDPKQYGYSAVFNKDRHCQEAVIKQLTELQQHAYSYLQQDSNNYFNALQNARLIKNVEAYYRAQIEGNVSSWNLRDQHMFETLLHIKAFKEQQTKQAAKIVIWAHNSHVGDAKATEMSTYGELNIGQLVKDKFDDNAFTIGYSTYTGTVTAASYWGGDTKFIDVKPALNGSYEYLFHQLEYPEFLLLLKNDAKVCNSLNFFGLERAIGVIYRPETERQSHYFYAKLPQQFDATIHFDKTRAIKPLTAMHNLSQEEFPETYPSGI